MCHCLRANRSFFQQPGLLLDQPRGAGAVFDLPVALVVLDSGLGQAVAAEVIESTTPAEIPPAS
jgi:hypothetical protein